MSVSFRVKPLVWRQEADNAWVTETYAIHQYWPHNNGHFRVHGHISGTGSFGLQQYDTLEAAKEAAQRHHNKRTLEAIESVSIDELVKILEHTLDDPDYWSPYARTTLLKFKEQA